MKHLNIEHIVVLGHSNCGGIHGLIEPASIASETYIQDWVAIASPALERLKNLTADETHICRTRHCEEGAVLVSLDNLLSYPWIYERVEQGTLKLHALYYDLREGELFRFSPDREDFFRSKEFRVRITCRKITLVKVAPFEFSSEGVFYFHISEVLSVQAGDFIKSSRP